MELSKLAIIGLGSIGKRHLEIAKLCLEHNCHFASTSYLNPDMLALDTDVKKQNLVFINKPYKFI